MERTVFDNRRSSRLRSVAILRVKTHDRKAQRKLEINMQRRQIAGRGGRKRCRDGKMEGVERWG